jgi:hypothetical protein
MAFDYNAQIDMRDLRRRLFGEDRLPRNERDVVYERVAIGNTSGTLILEADVLLKAEKLPRQLRRRGASLHRLFIKCPCCGGWVPAGRLAQHKPTCQIKTESAYSNAVS